MVRRFGIGRSILLGMLGFTIGNALIPLAPARARVGSLGAAFLIAQQLVGDSLATVYEITEVSLVQASVERPASSAGSTRRSGRSRRS